MSTTEKETEQPDEFARLEKMHRQSKAEQEAWRNLLEKLADLKKKPTDTPEPEQPKP